MRSFVIPCALVWMGLVSGCAPQAAEGSTDPPAPADPVASHSGPGVGQMQYVSSEEDSADPAESEPEPEPESEFGDAYAVQSPAETKELAEEAVSEQLNPQRTWRTSPVLPTQWPLESEIKEVMVLMYPLAAHPQRMNHFQLYSAAYRVRVSLVDGSTEVEELSKPRRLGKLVESRKSSIERRELETAEHALFRYMLTATQDLAENQFWGYRKFFHDNPKYTRDIARHVPRFVKWVRAR